MDWIVLLPPVLAIVLALWTRQIYLSLFVGLWLGTTILQDGNPVLGLRELGDQLVAVFASPSNTMIVLFCLLVGGLIALMQASGGVAGFVAWVQQRGWGRSRRGAEVLAWAVGLVIFVESNITSLTVGAVSRPLFDKLQLAREKVAFYCDATSAPVCMSIPLNAWGAYVLGLLVAQGTGASEAIGLLVNGVVFNFFAWLAIGFALLLALTGWSFGPMRRAEQRAAQTGELTRPGSRPMMSEEVAGIKPEDGVSPRAYNLLLPLGVMIGMIFAGLYITGEGSIMEGSGSTAVFWAVGVAVAAAMILYALPVHERSSILSPSAATDIVLKGSAGLLPVTLLIVLAFALGQVSRALEMGPYIVSVMGESGPTWWVPALIFLVGSVVSFTLGSSWTAFAIMIPVAMPLAEGLGVPPGLMLGAVLSGGVFGDYASPLSDTSIISSMAAACDHVDHVNTQLPYALLLAGVAVAGFIAAGALL